MYAKRVKNATGAGFVDKHRSWHCIHKESSPSWFNYKHFNVKQNNRGIFTLAPSPDSNHPKIATKIQI